MKCNQEVFLPAIFKKTRKVYCRGSISKILQEFQKLSDDEVQSIPQVYELRRFVDDIDLEPVHPDLQNACKGKFFDLIKEIYDLLKLIRVAQSNKHSHRLVTYLKNYSTRIDRYGSLHKFLTAPGIRFSKNYATMRGTTPLQATIFQRNIRLWNDFDGSFNNYCRFADKCTNEIARVQEQKSNFDQLGLVECSHVLEQTIKALQTEKKGVYYGFNVVQVGELATMLAKAAGYSVTPDGFIYIEPDLINKLISGQRFIDQLEYMPWLIPPLLFKQIPEDMRKVMEYLDNYPSLGRKRVFDRFWVLCPGFAHIFLNRVLVAKEYLIGLVESGKLPALFLGECDSKYYFLCHWG